MPLDTLPHLIHSTCLINGSIISTSRLQKLIFAMFQSRKCHTADRCLKPKNAGPHVSLPCILPCLLQHLTVLSNPSVPRITTEASPTVKAEMFSRNACVPLPEVKKFHVF